jgi:hypothetical protein
MSLCSLGEGEFLEGFLETGYVVGLGAFRTLNDVELDLVALFEAFVSFELDGTVMHEDIGSVVPAEKAVPFSVVEPFHGAFVLCHDALLLPWGPEFCSIFTVQ